MSWLTIRLAAGDVDATLTLDGASVERPLPTRIAIDRGRHELMATAPHKRAWKTQVVAETPGVLTVDVPALAAEKDAPAPVAGRILEPSEEAGALPTTRIVAIGVAAVGVVSLGIGTYFGIRTSSTWDDALAHCPNDRCDRDAAALSRDAEGYGDISTGAFVTGGVLIAVGAALWFFGGRSP